MLAADGFAALSRDDLIAPPLMWPEVRSALHEAMVRGAISVPVARESLTALEAAPIRTRNDGRLGERAWGIADRLGWMKTYDAEYLALAQLVRGALLTLDAGMRDAARRLGIEVAS